MYEYSFVNVCVCFQRLLSNDEEKNKEIIQEVCFMVSFYHFQTTVKGHLSCFLDIIMRDSCFDTEDQVTKAKLNSNRAFTRLWTELLRTRSRRQLTDLSAVAQLLGQLICALAIVALCREGTDRW